MPRLFGGFSPGTRYAPVNNTGTIIPAIGTTYSAHCIPPVLTLLGPRSRFGDKSLGIRKVCPLIETAVLKGIMVKPVCAKRFPRHYTTLLLRASRLYWANPPHGSVSTFYLFVCFCIGSSRCPRHRCTVIRPQILPQYRDIGHKPYRCTVIRPQTRPLTVVPFISSAAVPF